MKKTSAALILSLTLLATVGQPVPGQEPTAGTADSGQIGAERLTYSVTYLGIAVARAMLDQAPPAEPGGEWIVRGSSRTTRFWNAFFHIRNAYTTRFRMPGFISSAYERRVDQKGLRFRSMEWYGSGTASSLDGNRLPALPEGYQSQGSPERIEVEQVARGQGNLFTALWWVRYTDWDRTLEASLPIWVDGAPWMVTARRESEEVVRELGSRIDTWKIVVRLTKMTPDSEGTSWADRNLRTDYVTQELVREDATLTFWIEKEGTHRPIRLTVRRPRLTVKARIRRAFRDERFQ
jgi:hypothetical protein